MEINLVLKTEVIEIPTVAVTVDALATRYQVALGYDATTKMYQVSVPNFNISIETKYPAECSYKLEEKKIARGDAKVIVQIIKELLLDKLNTKAGIE